jgi:hypothetical protein
MMVEDRKILRRTDYLKVLMLLLFYAGVFALLGFCASRAMAQSISVPTAEALSKTDARVTAAEQRIEILESAIRKLQAPTIILPPVVTADPVAPVIKAPAGGTICGVSVLPKNELQKYTDAGVTTRVWREAVTACGGALSVMFWSQADHWMMSIERVVPDVFAVRAVPLTLTAELIVDGKSTGKIDGPLYDFQIAAAENKALAPAANPDALRAARLVPPIKLLRTFPSHWAVKPYTSLKDGPLERGMPNTGERADVGLIHDWCAQWLYTAADYWWTACVDAAKDAANIPWHVNFAGKANLFDAPAMRDAGFDARNEKGKVISLPAAPHEKLVFVPNKPNPPYAYDGVTKSSWTLDGAHQPFAALVPYMATRHPFYLYLAQYQFGVQFGGLQTPPGYGGRYDYPVPTVLRDQTRATAWSLRTMSQAVLMTPATVPDWLHDRKTVSTLLTASVQRYVDDMSPERDYWQALSIGTAGKPPARIYALTIKATGKEAFVAQPWERDYLTLAMGFANWAGVKEVAALDALMRDILIARYGTGSAYRRLGAPFSVVFNSRDGTLAKSMDDVLAFTPSENLTYGSNAPLVVGAGDSMGQWTPNGWQPQGGLFFCAANGDARCTEPLAWYNAQATKLGTADFDEYRMAN